MCSHNVVQIMHEGTVQYALYVGFGAKQVVYTIPEEWVIFVTCVSKTPYTHVWPWIKVVCGYNGHN